MLVIAVLSSVVLSLLLTSCSIECCSQSDKVSTIPDIRTCHNSSLPITFNLTGSGNCEQDLYRIYIYHHGQTDLKEPTQSAPPISYGDTCVIMLTLNDVTTEEYNNSTLQIRIYNTSGSSLTPLCSNNFILLVDEDPPDPVTVISSTVNCTGVYLNWFPPYTPPGCPILYYTFSINNKTIGNTTDSYYQLTNLPSNGQYTISITASNGAATSIERNSTFITATGPDVTVVSNTISLIPHSSVNASLNITAQVTNSNCPFSFPSQLSINISCTGVDQLYITVTDLSVTDGLIVQSVTVPTDLLYCTAELNWSNLYSYRQEHINQFNTTQLYYIQLFPVSNGLEYSCIYRQYSTLWGCGLRVNEQSSSIPSRSNSTRGAIDDLCPGNLNVTTYYYITSDNTSGHVIDHVTVSITGTKCTTALATASPSPGASTPSGTSNTGMIVVAIVAVILVLLLIVGAVVSVITVLVVLNRRKTIAIHGTTAGHTAEPMEEAVTDSSARGVSLTRATTTNDVLESEFTENNEVPTSELAEANEEVRLFEEPAPELAEADEEVQLFEEPAPELAEANNVPIPMEMECKNPVPESLPSNETAQQLMVTGLTAPKGSVGSAHSLNDDERSSSRRGSNISIPSMLSRASDLVNEGMNRVRSSLQRLSSQLSQRGKGEEEEEQERLLSNIEAGGTEIEDTNNVPPQNDDDDVVFVL